MSSSTELVPSIKFSPDVGEFSRFQNHPIYIDPDTKKKFLGAWRPPQIPLKQSDKSYLITQEMEFRPDLISYRYYNTPLLWWIIAYVNNVQNPLDRETGFYSGRIIRIPDINTISAALSL